VSDSHFPCRAHALLWPYRSSQGYGTARPTRDGLWATCPRSATSGYHAEFHKDCYQKHTNPPHNDPYLVLQRVVAAHYKTTMCQTVGLAVRIFPATTRTFTKDAALSEQGRVAARHVWINERHGGGMLCVNRPKMCHSHVILGHKTSWCTAELRILLQRFTFICHKGVLNTSTHGRKWLNYIKFAQLRLTKEGPGIEPKNLCHSWDCTLKGVTF
jgi:hypothetical protein